MKKKFCFFKILPFQNFFELLVPYEFFVDCFDFELVLIKFNDTNTSCCNLQIEFFKNCFVIFSRIYKIMFKRCKFNLI